MSLNSPFRYCTDDVRIDNMDKNTLVCELKTMSYKLRDISSSYDEPIGKLLPDIKNLIDESYRLINSIPFDDAPPSHKKLNDYLFSSEILFDDSYIFQDTSDVLSIPTVYSISDKLFKDSIGFPKTPQPKITTAL